MNPDEDPELTPVGEGELNPELDPELLAARVAESVPLDVSGKKPERSSAGEALALGAAQGGTLGFADEIHGGIDALREWSSRRPAETKAALSLLSAAGPTVPALGALGAVAGPVVEQGASNPPTSLAKNDLAAILEAYRGGRNTARLRDAEAREGQPVAYYGGEFAASAALPGPKAGPKASWLSNLGKWAKYGAATGAASGVGSSTAEDVGGMATDAALGGAVGSAAGAALGPTAEYFSAKGIPWALNKAREMARGRAVSAVAPKASLTNRLGKLGYNTEQKISDFGQDILDSEILRPLGTTAGAQKRADEKLSAVGRAIGDTLRGVDSATPEGFMPQRAWSEVADRVQKFAETATQDAEKGAVLGLLKPRIVGSPGQAVDPRWLGFGNAWKNKTHLQEALVPQSMSDINDRLYSEGVRAYRDDVLRQVGEVAGPEASEKLQALTRQYAPLAKMQELLREAVGREAAAKKPDFVDLASGGKLGDLFRKVGVEAGPVASLINAALAGRANSTLATGLNAVAKTPVKYLQPLPQAAAKVAPVEAARRSVSPTEKDEAERRAIDEFLGRNP